MNQTNFMNEFLYSVIDSVFVLIRFRSWFENGLLDCWKFRFEKFDIDGVLCLNRTCSSFEAP